MNPLFFESTLLYNWNMNPIDRSFDPIRVQTYLSQLPTINDRNFVLDLLNKTQYVPYSQFKNALLTSFEQFKRNIGH